ncbi:unnamed protein product [Caenorhabditis bovis]|uniref:Uncharacterized protein n=1 Tax=Caenorhabditis bovis TaxID=2654633 RepID=A0A8S1ER36_9PELO|nr:unnamed protein product [Caenorhabditis bovis]
MVSNLSTIFRTKNQTKKNIKNNVNPAVSSSSEEGNKATSMVLVPPVTVQKEKEEIKADSNEASSSLIEIPTVEVTSPTPEPNGDIQKEDNQKDGNGNSQAYEKMVFIEDVISQKFNETLEKIIKWKNEITTKIKESDIDFAKESVKIAYNVAAFLAIAFVSIVLVALFRSVFIKPDIKQNGWFCSWFAAPFDPLFNALCEQRTPNIADRFSNEIAWIFNDLITGVHTIFNNVCDGFAVFGTLFSAIFSGVRNNLCFGFHELGENVEENIAYLFRFVFQMFDAVIYLFTSTIATIAGGVAGIASSIQEFFSAESDNHWS